MFVFLSLMYLLFKHKCYQKVLVSIILITILISPYLYRNYNIFGEVTITKSFGYNLLKGNHPETVVEGVGMFRSVEKVIPETKEKLDELYALGPIKKHDLYKDKILLDQAIIFIKENPLTTPNLNIKQRLAHLEGILNWFNPISRCIFLLLPFIYSSFNIIFIKSDFSEFLYIFLPSYIAQIITFHWLSGRTQ